jgi:hypothetical protein
MAIPTKGSRTIIVDGHRYRYKVTGNVTVDLAVESDEGKGQLLTAGFLHGFQITPGFVSKIINHGLEKGWEPTEKGKLFHLGTLDDSLDMIDWDFHRNE